MGVAHRSTEARVAGALRLELRLIAEGVELVASGRVPSVTLAGLRFGDLLLAQARDLAWRHRVRVVPKWPADEAGLAMSIERLADAPTDEDEPDGELATSCLLGHAPGCRHEGWAATEPPAATQRGGRGLPEGVQGGAADVVVGPITR